MAESPITTQVALAAHFKTNTNTVQKWVNRSGFPGGKSGPWNSAEVGKFLKKIKSPLAPGASKAAKKTLTAKAREAKLKKLIEDARYRKIKNDQLEGRLLDRADVESVIKRLIILIRDRLQDTPVEVTTELDPSIREGVRERIATRMAWVLRSTKQCVQEHFSVS